MTKRIPGALVVLFALGCATTPPRVLAPKLTQEEADRCAAMGRELVAIAPDASLPVAVEAVACAGRLTRQPVAEDRWYVRRHQQFNERTTSALETATMILAFTEEGNSHLTTDLESFGYIYDYARELSLPRVETDLRAFPDEVARPFRTRLQSALARLTERAKRLHGREREIFVDLLPRVRREHLAQAKAVASFERETTELLQTIDAALAEPPPSERLSRLMHEAEHVRESVLIRCTDRRALQDCLDGPLVRPLSERLVRLALAVGDIPRATAERDQLRQGADKSTLARHLDAELRRALSAHGGSETAGVEGTAMTAALDDSWPEGVAPLAWGPAAAAKGEMGSAQLPETLHVEGVIKSCRGHAGGMEILLENGSSVVLPAAEAHVLKYGEKLVAIVERETRRGVVLYAHHYRSARIVQFRGTRLGGTRGVQMAEYLAKHP